MTILHLDWTINVGNIISSAIVITVALFRIVGWALKKITARMEAMENRVDLMWGWMIISMTAEQREQYDTWIRNHPKIKIE